MHRHPPAPVLANPFSGRHPHAVGLPWWGGALLAFTVAVPPLAGQPPPAAEQAETRINFPNSLAPLPRHAHAATDADLIAGAEPFTFQIAFRDPSLQDYLAVVDWLKAQGFATSNVDPDRRVSIDAKGTVAQVHAALNVRFEHMEIGGRVFTVAVTTPSLPASVGRAVMGINGLQPFLRANKGPLAVPITRKSAGR